ncbi:MAG: hypothetical protein VYE22_04275 [Myxococcota bacterium]|nr:hypothetical protein [Myxococcota bacterium]
MRHLLVLALLLASGCVAAHGPAGDDEVVPEDEVIHFTHLLGIGDQHFVMAPVARGCVVLQLSHIPPRPGAASGVTDGVRWETTNGLFLAAAWRTEHACAAAFDTADVPRPPEERTPWAGGELRGWCEGAVGRLEGWLEHPDGSPTVWLAARRPHFGCY